MRAIYVKVSDPARRALCTLAEREMRDPREQAAYLIIEGLRRSGDLHDGEDGPCGCACHPVAGE